VSPSWRDRIDLFLGPLGVRIARTRRGLRPRADRELSVAADGASGWPALIDALARALPELGDTRADVRATVSNHFVRYALLPGVELLAADEERVALARHQFQVIHGDRAAGWRVAIAEHGSRTASLAAALDADFLDALVATLTAAGHAPRSVEPLMAVAANACRREIRGGAAWLAVAEPGRLCVGRIADQRWVDVRNVRASGASDAQLAVVLEQMRIAAGVPAGPVFFVSEDAVDPTPSVGPGWTVHPVRLEGEGAREHREAA
jgi:hypothetical protein